MSVAAALYQALKETSPSSRHNPLRYRIYNRTMGFVQGWIPAVRTDYAIYGSLSHNRSVTLAVCYRDYDRCDF